jgi:predicted AlkP superfamily pyrophosphatase or phosphodiesterase
MPNPLHFDSHRCLPDYKTGNFAHLPGLLQSLLGHSVETPLSPQVFGFRPGQFKNVIFLFLDAFGWNTYSYFLNRRNRVISKLASKGQVRKLTSQFPSTTAAHVTTFNTGQPVARHGVLEWQYYEPVVDDVIIPLLFCYAGEKKRDRLREEGYDPFDMLPHHTIYQDLQQSGVPTYAFIPAEYVGTGYDDVQTAGSELIPYYTLADAFSTLKRKIGQVDVPALYYFYTPLIDALAHKYGPFSHQSLAELDATFMLMDHFLFHGLRGRDDTLVIISADHGQIATDPSTAFFINLQPEFKALEPMLRRNRQERVLPPGGGPRDAFLYVKDAHLAQAHELLQTMLAGRADVFRTEALIRQGLFGPEPPSRQFMSRVGNLLILPRHDNVVWWYEKGRFEVRHHGMHGGLSCDEMEIPLIVYQP